MNLVKGIAAGVLVALARAAIDGETRARVSGPGPWWWQEIGHLWSSRAWETDAPEWGRGMVWGAARAVGVPAEVVAAVIHVESRWWPDAVSPAGAIGLMQLMPATARELGVDPWNPGQNVVGGARYLRAMLDRLGTTAAGLAAYNAGPGRARLPWASWPGETQAYVAAVLGRLERPRGRDFRRGLS